ncbi:hypothetical protein ACRRTK_008087 [Alexandromys fortis]
MYFFLHILSALEICSTSVTIPLLLHHLLTCRCHIPCSGCALQMFFFLCFGANECCLLGLRDSTTREAGLFVKRFSIYLTILILNNKNISNCFEEGHITNKQEFRESYPSLSTYKALLGPLGTALE